MGGSGDSRSQWDIIVVGCGVMGASVTYNLAQRGLRVLTLDMNRLNHEYGSSHGQTRIIRLAYYEDPRYVPLLRRAFDSWRELEAKSGKRLMQITGGLMIGRSDGELVAGVLRSARVHGLRHQVLSSSEVERRFPAFTVGEEYGAVYEESAGMLFAEDCVRAFVDQAREEGAEFRFSEKVGWWRNRPDGVEVGTPSGVQTAERLILCGGPWNGELLGGRMPLRCERQVPLWFPSGGMGEFAPEKMPVFIMEEAPGVFYYGLPDVGHGVKVARTHGGEFSAPDEVRREVTDADVKPVREFISRTLKNLGRVPTASTTCIYTNTPDLNFAVGSLGAEPRVKLVSACSGHGFKFASVLGEVASDIATEKKAPLDVAFLDPDRFAGPTG